MSDTASQNERILGALREGFIIDPLGALKTFGVLRLSGRIYDLKNLGYLKRGETIESEPYTNPRTGKRYARYWLARKRKAAA